MNMTLPPAPAGMHPDEWELRLELAACYRLFDYLGWTELIFNHITSRVPASAQEPGAEPEYLINPFGLHYSEVTASNLVKVSLSGKVAGSNPGQVNLAGFIIHSAIHAARDDAHCVMHIHTTEGIAIACKAEGLRHDNFYSAVLYGDLAYHDFEGITTNPDEQPRLVGSLGDKNHLILRNHGLLTAGPDIPVAFKRMWTLQRACEIQLASDAGAGLNIPIAQPILETSAASRLGGDAAGRAKVDRLAFEAMLRRAGIRRLELAE
ncbi:MAG: class II aldolase/adducin family protein [Pigmentiphaga sp.]|nr:class II aldolase/adducin family protein [Pigmentiphaga sp.]